MVDDSEDQVPAYVIACGTRREEYGDSAVRWVLLDRAAVEAEYGPASEWDENTLYTVSGLYGAYGGPGRWFWNGPYERVTRTRVLVKQRGGYDI